MNKKGSGIIIVIILSMVLIIYMSSVFLKVENYSILREKYDNLINNLYSYDNLEEIYNKIIN